MNDINTTAISNSLDNHAKEIKINDSTYNEIRERRDTIKKFINEYTQSNNIRMIENFNVGSYKIKTGVKYHDNSYDIDYAFVFQEMDNPGAFKESLTNWLRPKIKEHYKLGTRIASKKSVIAIRFYDRKPEASDKKTIFHLDIAIYIEKNNNIYHIKKDEFQNYSQIISEPKKTYERQQGALDESHGQNSKRNTVILLKDLRSRNMIKGTSSIYITDKIISYNDNLDTFSLMKKLIDDSKFIQYFKLCEKPSSELIENHIDLNESSETLSSSFEGSSTIEVFDKLQKIFNHKLVEIPKEDLESKTERHFGG